MSKRCFIQTNPRNPTNASLVLLNWQHLHGDVEDKGMHGCSLYQADLSFVSGTCVSLYLLSNITACTVMISDVEFMTEVSGGDGDKYETGLNMIVFVG